MKNLRMISNYLIKIYHMNILYIISNYLMSNFKLITRNIFDQVTCQMEL